MNDTVTCVVLCEGCDDETKAQCSEAMLPVATEAFDAAKAAGCESGMLFFTATETSDVVYQLRMSCELGEPSSTPQVCSHLMTARGALCSWDLRPCPALVGWSLVRVVITMR